MKHTKWKYILQTLVVVSVLAALLVSMNGCKKKKPDATESSSTAETSTETTGTAETTTETTGTAETTETTGTAETTETTVALCEHVLGNWIVDETANCTKEGSRHKACTNCGEKVVTEAIPMTAHTASAWLGDPATCTKESTQYQQCTQCDKKLVTIVVDKADHSVLSREFNQATTYYWCKNQGCSFEQKSYDIPAAGTVPYQIQEHGTTCTITGLDNSWTGSELILPERINGKTVTAIDANAFANFANRTSIKTVYIPKTITEIGDKAFSGCSALTTIAYGGVMKDWVLVVKGAQWNQNTGSYQIYCNNRILSK